MQVMAGNVFSCLASSSDNISSECDNGQHTIQVEIPIEEDL